jgi:hypothetical protein
VDENVGQTNYVKTVDGASEHRCGDDVDAQHECLMRGATYE